MDSGVVVINRYSSAGAFEATYILKLWPSGTLRTTWMHWWGHSEGPAYLTTKFDGGTIERTTYASFEEVTAAVRALTEGMVDPGVLLAERTAQLKQALTKP